MKSPLRLGRRCCAAKSPWCWCLGESAVWGSCPLHQEDLWSIRGSRSFGLVFPAGPLVVLPLSVMCLAQTSCVSRVSSCPHGSPCKAAAPAIACLDAGTLLRGSETLVRSTVAFGGREGSSQRAGAALHGLWKDSAWHAKTCRTSSERLEQRRSRQSGDGAGGNRGRVVPPRRASKAACGSK